MLQPQLPNAAHISDSASPLYFLHIPKTAGTTFNQYLESHFVADDVCPAHLWRELIAQSPESVAGKRLIWGHFYAFVHRHVSSPLRYLVFLRDPVERALSHYGHILAHPDHYLHAKAVELGSLSSFLADPVMRTTVENFHIRSLAQDADPHAIARELGPQELAQGILERRLMTPPLDKPIESMLATAKERLLQMCFVGITERYDESIRMLARQLGWPVPAPGLALNVNERRPKRHEITAGELEQLRALNEADCELYACAVELFENTLARTE